MSGHCGWGILEKHIEGQRNSKAVTANSKVVDFSKLSSGDALQWSYTSMYSLISTLEGNECSPLAIP
jgi:hypothetical protein